MQLALLTLITAQATYIQAGSSTVFKGFHQVRDAQSPASRTTSSEDHLITQASLVQLPPNVKLVLTPSLSGRGPFRNITTGDIESSGRSARDIISKTNESAEAKGNNIENVAVHIEDCTVNAEAGLVWWYPDALYNAVGSISTVTGANQTAFTLLPATTMFKVSEALESARVSMSFGDRWDTIRNTTEYFGTMITLPPPQAASTVYATVNSVSAFPTGTFVKPQGGWFLEAPNPTYIMSSPRLSATPYEPILYITQIEIVSLEPFDLDTQPTRRTRTEKLITPVLIAFPVVSSSNLPNVATPTGELDGKVIEQNFPSYSRCTPGTWSAPQPTMIIIIVVTVNVNPDWEIQLVHAKKPASVLDGPNPPQPSSQTRLVLPLTEAPQQIVTSLHSTEDQQTPVDPSNDSTTQEPQIALIAPSQTSVGLTPPTGPGFDLSGLFVTSASSSIGFIINSQTLTAGGLITAAQSNLVSLDSNPTPTKANINGSPQLLDSITKPPYVYVSGTPFPEQANGEFIIEDQTLRPGHSIVIAGTTVSLGDGPNPSQIVFDDTTSNLISTTLPVLTLSATVYTATFLPGGYVIASQTLKPGGLAITVSGTTYSLPVGDTAIVVNGQTSTLSTQSGTTSKSSTAMAVQRTPPSLTSAAGLRLFQDPLPFVIMIMICTIMGLN